MQLYNQRKMAGLGIISSWLLLTSTAFGGNKAWTTGTPANSNFSGANWVSGTSGSSPLTTLVTGDSLYFNTSSQLNLTNDTTSFTFGGLTFNSGASAFTIQSGSSLSIAGGITNNSSSAEIINLTGNLAVSGAGNQALSGVILTGAGSLVMNSSGILTLTNSSLTNGYTGGTVINSGTLVTLGQVGSGGNELGTGPVTINSGATLIGANGDAFGYLGYGFTIITNNGGTITDLGTSSYKITFPSVTFRGGTLTSAPGNNGDINGSYAFGGSPVVTTLASTNTAVISAGKVTVTAAPLLFNIAAGNVSGGATPGVDLLISSVMASYSAGTAGPITKAGAGVMSLTGVNTFTNTITINGGTLAIDGAGQLGGGSYNTSITNNATLAYNSSANQTLGGVISGNGALIKNGNGTLTLTNTSPFNGPITINNGSLLLNGLIGSGNFTNTITNNATLVYSNTPDQILGGVISGTGALVVEGYLGGALILTNVNSYNGPITLHAGVLQIDGAGQLGNGNFTNTINDGFFNGQLNYRSTADQTFSGAISITNVGLLYAYGVGIGTMTMTATNFLTSVNFTDGTLKVGGAGILNSVLFNATAPGVLVFNSSRPQSLGYSFSGNGSLIQNSPSTLLLTNNSTFTGSINILNGTFALAGAGAISNTASLSLAGGTTLDVSGSTGTSFNLSPTNLLSVSGTSTNYVVITNLSGRTVNFGSRPVSLTIAPTSFRGDSNHPALLVQSAQLVLNGNAFTVTNAGAGTLHQGAYLLATNAGATISSAGIYPGVTIRGPGALVSTGTVSVLGSGLYLNVTNSPPTVSAPMTVSASPGYTLKIALADLLAFGTTNWVDPDGGVVTLAGINLTTTNGITLTTNNAYIFYNAKVTVADQITYTVKDDQGITATGIIRIVPSSGALVGQTSGSISVVGNQATVNFAGIPGSTNYVQRTATLSPAAWLTVATNIAPTNGVFSFTDSNAPAGSAYYRLSTLP